MTILALTTWASYSFFKNLISTSSDKETPVNKDLQDRVDNLAKKMGMHKPISVVASADNWNGLSYSASFLNRKAHINTPRWTSSGIRTDLGAKIRYAYGSSKEAEDFILAHEIAHIINNDGIWRYVFIIIVPLAIAAFASLFIPIIFADLLGTSCLLILYPVYSKYRERQADLLACEYMTDKEKTAFICLFKSMLKRNLEYRNAEGLSTEESNKRKKEFDSEGNNFEDFSHPHITTRIQYIESTLQNRAEALDPEGYVLSLYRNEEGIGLIERIRRYLLLDRVEIEHHDRPKMVVRV